MDGVPRRRGDRGCRGRRCRPARARRVPQRHSTAGHLASLRDPGGVADHELHQPTGVAVERFASHGGITAAVTCPGFSTCYTAKEGIGPAPAVVEVSVDGGLDWQPSTLPAGWQLTSSLACPSPSECLAGASTSSAAGIVVTTDRGSHLVGALATGFGRSGDGSGLWFGRAMRCRRHAPTSAPGSVGTSIAVPLSVTGDTSGAVEDLPQPFVAYNPEGLACASDGKLCVLVGATSFAVPSLGTLVSGAILRSTDGGRTWSRADLPTTGGQGRRRLVPERDAVHRPRQRVVDDARLRPLRAERGPGQQRRRRGVVARRLLRPSRREDRLRSRARRRQPAGWRGARRTGQASSPRTNTGGRSWATVGLPTAVDAGPAAQHRVHTSTSNMSRRSRARTSAPAWRWPFRPAWRPAISRWCSEVTDGRDLDGDGAHPRAVNSSAVAGGIFPLVQERSLLLGALDRWLYTGVGPRCTRANRRRTSDGERCATEPKTITWGIEGRNAHAARMAAATANPIWKMVSLETTIWFVRAEPDEHASESENDAALPSRLSACAFIVFRSGNLREHDDERGELLVGVDPGRGTGRWCQLSGDAQRPGSGASPSGQGRPAPIRSVS